MKVSAALLALSVLLVVAPAIANDEGGDNEAKPAVDSAVEVDLRNNRLTGRLPFDVPFEFRGDMPDGVERIALAYRDCGAACADVPQFKRGADCSLVLDDKWKPSKPIDPNNPNGRTEVSPITSQVDVFTPAAAADKPRTFNLPMPDLEAQKRYQFVFDLQGPPNDARRTEFANRAQEVIRNRLATFSSSDQTQQAYADLRNDLRMQVRALASCADDRGTLFDPAKDVDQGFSTAIASVIDAQAQRLTAIERFNDRAGALAAKLQEISQSPLPLLVRRLAALAADTEDAALTAELADRAHLVTFVRRDAAELRAIARGSAPSAPDLALMSLRAESTAEEVRRRAMGLAETRSLLLELRAWLRELDADRMFERLQSRGDLTAGQIRTIREISAPRDRGGKIEAAAGDAFAAGGAASNFADRTDARQASIVSMAATVREQLRAVRLVGADTIGTFNTFSSWYVSADAGFAYAPTIEATVPYLGANIYFRPINKDAPLRLKGGWKRRLSATLAVTLQSVADENKTTRDDLFGSQALVVGGGYRLTDTVRFGLGAVVFRRADPNVLRQRKELGAAPYASVSFDWNVAKQFAGIGKLFSPGS